MKLSSKLFSEVNQTRVRYYLKWSFLRLKYLQYNFRTMPVPANYGGQGPSCFDRVKMGFMMGMCVGMASGAIFGGFNCLRFGLRGRELISQVGKVMVQGGGTFGTFMAIGTGIRC